MGRIRTSANTSWPGHCENFTATGPARVGSASAASLTAKPEPCSNNCWCPSRRQMPLTLTGTRTRAPPPNAVETGSPRSWNSRPARRSFRSRPVSALSPPSPSASMTYRTPRNLVLLDDGTAMAASTLRRMLCDAKVYPAVLGGAGQVLDLGRSARTAPPALRRALVLRDKGCTYPGCALGPKWTEPHHVVPWADGGATDSSTMALVCTRHHRLVHHSGWDITILDGAVRWIPPAILDPERKPLRNTAHDSPPPWIRASHSGSRFTQLPTSIGRGLAGKPMLRDAARSPDPNTAGGRYPRPRYNQPAWRGPDIGFSDEESRPEAV